MVPNAKHAFGQTSCVCTDLFNVTWCFAIINRVRETNRTMASLYTFVIKRVYLVLAMGQDYDNWPFFQCWLNVA